jgi:hypothetical protein
LSSVEQKVEREVARLYQVPFEHSHVAPPIAQLDRTELARRWVSYALGQILGRWAPDESPSKLEGLSDEAFLGRVHDRLFALCSGAETIDAELGGIRRFITRDFFGWHARLYKHRPVVWQIGAGEEAVLVAHDRAIAATVRGILRGMRARLPEGWDRFVDDGILINLAPLREWIPDNALRRRLEMVARDLGEGRYDWSGTRLCRGRARGAIFNPAPSREFAPTQRRRRRLTAASRDARPART